METQPKIALGISHQPSFIADKIFLEQIPLTYVEQLIQSDCLKSKWDITIYSQKIASQLYINEQQQLQSYVNKYNKTKGAFPVTYNKAKHGWGRVFPAKSLGLTSFSKKTRNTLIKDLYYDFDLKNAQPEILRCICFANNISSAIISDYCTRREEIIINIINSSAGEADRALVKSLIIRLSFYGGFSGWLKENNIKEFPTPLIVQKYSDEVKRIAILMKAANPELYKTMERIKTDKGEKNVMGSFLSTYLQEYELRIVENVLKYLCCETDICITDFPNYFNAIYEYDGLKLLKSKVDAFGGVEKVLELMNKLNVDMGFDILWEVKPIEKFYDIEFIAPPTEEEVFAEKELLKNSKILEKEKNKEIEKKKRKEEKKMEKKEAEEEKERERIAKGIEFEARRNKIINDKRNKIALNDLEASQIIYSEIKENIKFSNKILYYKHNYIWISNYEMIKSILGNYIRNSNIKCLNALTHDLEDFVQHRKCGQNVLNDVIDIATINYDNMWSNKMFSSSLGKILFINGYYNFHTGRFYKHCGVKGVPETFLGGESDSDYDHSIIFTELIPYAFVAPVENDEEDEEDEEEASEFVGDVPNFKYIASIKKRLFIDPFGEDVANYYILNIARGLAGDAMKRVIFNIGEGDTGKSMMTAAFETTFGGYFGTFNANNLVVKKMTTGDDAQQSRWIMMLLSKRIIASNEVEPDAIINGTLVKKLSSGGLDKIVARGHGGYETEFWIYFLCFIFANDLDKIRPMDDAIINRVRAIPYTKKYVDNPTPNNPFELKKDANMSEEIKTMRFKLGFMYLLMESYEKFMTDDKRVETEPADIGKAIVNTFGESDDFITILQEDYNITGLESDFVLSSDLDVWIKEKKLAITMTKLGRDLNKYAELHNMEFLHNVIKKIGGKPKRGWSGIKLIPDIECDL